MSNNIITRYATISDRIVDIWQNIVNAISEILLMPIVMINRLDPPELEVFRSSINTNNPFPSGTRMPMAGVYCEGAARRRQMLQVNNALKDPEWAGSLTAKAGIISYLGFPVFWPDGSIFGTICIVDRKENEWGKKFENLLYTFKTSIEAHLGLVDSYEQLKNKQKELERNIKEIKTLRGILPICIECKKIRDDMGYWRRVEEYIKAHSEADFSHSICPECMKVLYPDIEG